MANREAGDGAVTGLAVGYVVAVVVCPIAWIWLWISAFGLWGPIEPGSPAAIPGLLALFLPPVIGIALGWKARMSSRRRTWVPAIVAPVVPLAIVVAAYVTLDYAVTIQESVLPWFGLVALYTCGPVVLGRLLGAVASRLRRPPVTA